MVLCKSSHVYAMQCYAKAMHKLCKHYRNNLIFGKYYASAVRGLCKRYASAVQVLCKCYQMLCKCCYVTIAKQTENNFKFNNLKAQKCVVDKTKHFLKAVEQLMAKKVSLRSMS